MIRHTAFTLFVASLLCAAALAGSYSPADSLRWTSLSAAGGRANMIETFESFNPGPLQGQQGWDGYGPSISVITDTPISGNQSARHTSDGSGSISFDLAGPAFTPAFGLVAADLRLSSNALVYQFAVLGDVPTGLGGTYFNTRVSFEPDGSITALQYIGGTGVFQPTTGAWSPGVPFQIAVEVLDTGVLNVYQNAVSIFTGSEIGFAATGTPGRSIQYLGWTDNAPGSTGECMTIDNVVPEPAAAMILLAMAAMARRTG